MEGESINGLRRAIEQYHVWYYDNRVWETVSFLGVPCLKSICDLWNYQEVITAMKPSLVIEFGTYNGGSTLFFSTILKQVRPDSKVLTVDVDSSLITEKVVNNPHVEFLVCSSTDPKVAARIKQLRAEHPGPAFIILDSAHEKQHVLAELKSLREVTRPNDYLVVEDTNLNGHPVLPGWGEGPMEALVAYKQEFPFDYVHDTRRENKFGFTFAPRGYLIRRDEREDKPNGLLAELQRQEQALAEQLKKQNSHANVLQVFWQQEGIFSEYDSIKEPLETNGRARRYKFQIPAGTQGPIRLDPATGRVYGEIYSIVLYAGDSQQKNGLNVLARWSAENDFANLAAASGVARLPGKQSYRFISIENDPQILLNYALPADEERDMILELLMSASDDAQKAIFDEVRKFEDELISKQRQLDEHAEEMNQVRSSLLAANESLSQQIEDAQQLHDQLRQQEAAIAQARADHKQLKVDFKAEQKRLAQHAEELVQQIKDKDSEIEGLSKEAQQLRDKLHQQRDQLRQQHDQLRQQEAAIAQARADHKQLKVDFKAEQKRLAQHAEELVQQIKDKDSEIEGLSTERAKAQRQIEHITGTLGWKLLSVYGPIKHRLLLPIYRTARYAPEALSKHEYNPMLSPLHDISPAKESRGWQSTGRDPQLNVHGPWPKGWAKISIHIEAVEPYVGRARLYIDRGEGYSEAGSYDLGEVNREQVRYVKLGPDVVAMRLDPFESISSFKIKKFTLKRVTRHEALKREADEQSSGLKQFARFSMARARSFREKHGRWPGPQDLPSAMRRTLRAWRYTRSSQHHDEEGTTVEAPPNFQPPATIDRYQSWLEVNRWNSRREQVLRERLSKLTSLPLLSIVMPVYNPPVEFLDKAIESVAAQVYDNWELCIADDASTDPAVRASLEGWAERDHRIRIVFREENGHICLATNSAAELAHGDFLVLMDQDDEITPDALGEVAIYVSENPETDILYSDDDKINTQGDRFAPQFKPDWSPELLLSYMYFSHLFVLRRELYWKAGGLRVGFEGSQDYDLALRATEIAHRVGHIPKVLYHWRVLPGSTASSGMAKPESFEAARRAVQEAFDRRGIRAKVNQPDWAVKAACGIFSHRFPNEGPRVAVIIPTKNQVSTLRKCVESLAKTTYNNYEIVIVDNESDDRETLDYLKEIPHRVLRIGNPGKRFNFAAINNRAVEQVDADYVLFLNNDTEVIEPEWLSQMVGYLSMPGVGAVGARLLFPDGRIQHAGIIHGYYNGMAGPAFKLQPAWNHGYLSYAMVSRNYLAVTAACMLTPRDLFLKSGGFDEQNFSVAYNDVDYCYRLQSLGHRIVYCPTAELTHHEGYSRGFVDNPAEPAAFRKKYGDKIDPFYNPNLSLEHERFAIDSRTIAPEGLKPIRTLMCAFNLNREGAPYSQFELTIRLKRDGVIDPLVYCPEDGPLRKDYEEAGIQVEVFNHPLLGVYSISEYERAINKFAERINEWNVEVVYGNTRQTVYAIGAAHRAGLPSIWNPRESEPWETYFDFLGPEIAARALECYSYPYKVVFVAEASRERCMALNSHNNFMTIHNGPDHEKFRATLASWPRPDARKHLGLDENQVAILLLGTVCDRKGQIDLVEAVGQIDERLTQRLKCFIVGDRPGHYSRQMKETIELLPVAKRECIEVIAETSNVALYYSAADVFVCTSRLESFPRVILEAMAASLPIITTPVFGISEQVLPNINALIYNPGDTKELAEHIAKLLEDSPLRQKLAANSRHVLGILIDYDGMVSAYTKVFREAWLSGRSR